MLRTILDGKTDPDWLADSARGKLRGRRDELRQTEERIGRIERRLASAM